MKGDCTDPSHRNEGMCTMHHNSDWGGRQCLLDLQMGPWAVSPAKKTTPSDSGMSCKECSIINQIGVTYPSAAGQRRWFSEVLTSAKFGCFVVVSPTTLWQCFMIL